MYNIAVIGKSSEVRGFMALGFDVKPAADGREALSILKDLLASKKYAVIFIAENYADELSSELEKFRDDIIPAILPIPTPSEDSGFGMKSVSDSVIRAVGSDII